jgi:hypothetical protein
MLTYKYEHLAKNEHLAKRVERWRQVLKFPAYEVSSSARVRRVATGRLLEEAETVIR